MTLLEILVKELPKHGGWPSESIHALVQGNLGGVYCKGFDSPLLSLRFAQADDWELAEVTRDQYEAALSASNNPEWNGEGLPPVGCVVEVRSEDFEGDWITIKVVYVHNEEVVGVVQSESEHLNDRLEKFSRNYNRAEFRPILSEADRKRREVAQALIRFLDLETDINNVFDAWDVKDFHDYIAAGKIPGIRIE